MSEHVPPGPEVPGHLHIPVVRATALPQVSLEPALFLADRVPGAQALFRNLEPRERSGVGDVGAVGPARGHVREDGAERVHPAEVGVDGAPGCADGGAGGDGRVEGERHGGAGGVAG